MPGAPFRLSSGAAAYVQIKRSPVRTRYPGPDIPKCVFVVYSSSIDSLQCTCTHSCVQLRYKLYTSDLLFSSKNKEYTLFRVCCCEVRSVTWLPNSGSEPGSTSSVGAALATP